MSSCRPLQSSPAVSSVAGSARRRRRRPRCSFLLDFLAFSEKLYVCRSAPLACTCQVSLVAPLSGEALTQVRDLLPLDLILLPMGVKIAGGVMTKFIARNTTVLVALNSDVHAKGR